MTPTHRMATAVPLSFIILVSGVKEYLEDRVKAAVNLMCIEKKIGRCESEQ